MALPDTDSEMKILYFDIETTGGFSASFGRILCLSYQWDGARKAHTLQAGTLREEKQLLRDLEKLWDHADIVVTYNGRSFDMRFLQSRFMKHIGRTLPLKKHLDLLKVVKRHLRLGRHTLANVASYLELDEQKMHVPPETWIEAMEYAAGTRAGLRAMKTITARCESDVTLLLRLLRRLRPLVGNIIK